MGLKKWIKVSLSLISLFKIPSSIIEALKIWKNLVNQSIGTVLKGSAVAIFIRNILYRLVISVVIILITRYDSLAGMED